MFLRTIKNWFAGPRPSSSPRRRATVSLRLECLESREVPAQLGGLAINLPSSPTALVSSTASQTVSMHQKIVAFCQSHRGLKVGGGECAQLPTEALRVAGADFTAGDPKHNGDYTWGKLVTTITHGHDSSTARCQPGDIIQYQNVKLSSGWFASNHTAIVATVDSLGRPTQVYEQNVGVSGKSTGAFTQDRTERLDSMVINKNTLLAGTIHVYRAAARTDSAGAVRFTVVNDTTRAQAVTVYFNGVSQGTLSLDSFNKANSYTDAWFSNSGRGNWSIGINGHSVSLRDAGGYEVFKATNGQASIRAI